MLVLEDLSSRREDEKILQRSRRRDIPLRYEHISDADAPILWVSDAVAWCHGRGGEWLPISHGIHTDVIQLGD